MIIWKYTLRIADKQTVQLPADAKILTVQLQHGQPQLWILGEETAPKTLRIIEMHGTGNQIYEDPGQYLGTFQMETFVFHVFEGLKL